MTLLRWRPNANLMGLNEGFNRLWDHDFWKDFNTANSLTEWTPVTDIFETKDEYVLKLELPGIKKDQVKIEFVENRLTIEGERQEEKEVDSENYHRTERRYGSFCRTFTLPKNIDDKKIKANMKDGILELRIPKAEEAKTKAIPISIN